MQSFIIEIVEWNSEVNMLVPRSRLASYFAQRTLLTVLEHHNQPLWVLQCNQRRKYGSLCTACWRCDDSYMQSIVNVQSRLIQIQTLIWLLSHTRPRTNSKYEHIINYKIFQSSFELTRLHRPSCAKETSSWDSPTFSIATLSVRESVVALKYTFSSYFSIKINI